MQDSATRGGLAPSELLRAGGPAPAAPLSLLFDIVLTYRTQWGTLNEMTIHGFTPSASANTEGFLEEARAYAPDRRVTKIEVVRTWAHRGAHILSEKEVADLRLTWPKRQGSVAWQ